MQIAFSRCLFFFRTISKTFFASANQNFRFDGTCFYNTKLHFLSARLQCAHSQISSIQHCAQNFQIWLYALTLYTILDIRFYLQLQQQNAPSFLYAKSFIKPRLLPKKITIGKYTSRVVISKTNKSYKNINIFKNIKLNTVKIF